MIEQLLKDDVCKVLILKIDKPTVYKTHYIRKTAKYVHQQVTSFSGLVVKLAVAKRLTAPSFG
jgi:hypothetical protein